MFLKIQKEGVAWKQTSYNKNFRRYFAGPDLFIYQKEMNLYHQNHFRLGI
jgi:hypothetical protein